MSAHDSLGPQFFHGSDADLNVGDEIKPASTIPGGGTRFSSHAAGHDEFTWMTPHAGNATFFGTHVYQVEPQGLTNQYNYNLHRRSPTHPADEDAHVSLAPAKIVRKGRTVDRPSTKTLVTNAALANKSIRWEDET